MMPTVRPVKFLMAALLSIGLYGNLSVATYTAPARSFDPKVEKLLRQMTLEEKIGQMTQICFSTITLDGTKNLELNPEAFREAILEHHVGSFLSGTGPAEKWVKFVTQVQHIAVEETRLGIPLLIGIDHVHGSNYVDEGTIFPHNLGVSCGFDTALVAEAARITAQETAALGIQWNFAPVLDLGKNPYWPRLYETFGEDPHVCAMMGKAYVEAFQQIPEGFETPLAACAKHFIGYSDPKSGWDRTPSEIPEQLLHEFFAPAFQAAFDAGVKSVMVNSGELNGEPVHASKHLLYDLLRKKMGFQGVVLTDIKDIDKIIELHQGATDVKAATQMAIEAGIDMNMACNAFHFCQQMQELVAEGKITESRIDESVRRILQLKVDLGLFEHPYPDGKHLSRIGSEAHRDFAKKVAAESMVLLKNQGQTLPLSPDISNLLVAGFAADSKHFLNGPWTFEWLGQPDESHQPPTMHTLFSALQANFPQTDINVYTGSEQAAFQKMAAQAEAIVLTVGEKPYSEFKGNISDLTLGAEHAGLAQWALASGKPVILVLVEGRPRILGELAEKAQAIIFAGYPGYGGAEAIARVISGAVNPSGKLSFSYPAAPGHYLPYYYKPSEKYFLEYQSVPQALYPFGHGLSYTEFEYGELALDAQSLDKNGKITAKVAVRNRGQREGKEAVLWYLSDHTGSITRPVKQLKHFEKRSIAAGETAVFTFEITPAHLSYPDRDGNTLLEPGQFTLEVGGICADFTLE